jgi:hypothetical protein
VHPERFVRRLAAAEIGETFNFYRDGDRAEVRRRRLRDYLDERAAAKLLLVGEAAGYRGARVSGIPFTSERQLTGEGPAEALAGSRDPGGELGVDALDQFDRGGGADGAHGSSLSSPDPGERSTANCEASAAGT